MPSKSIVNEQRAGLISWDLETPEGRAFLEQLDNQDYLRSALMSYGSTARVGDMLWTVSSGEGSEWVVDIDRMATEDRMRSEEVNLFWERKTPTSLVSGM